MVEAATVLISLPRFGWMYAALSFQTRCKNVPGLASVVRRAVTQYAEVCDAFDTSALHDIELAVGEALANAVEHGKTANGWIGTSCVWQDDGLKVTIRDNGAGFDPARLPRADSTDRLRGYGIVVMRELMDQVIFHNRGRSVTLIKFPVNVRTVQNPAGEVAL